MRYNVEGSRCLSSLTLGRLRRKSRLGTRNEEENITQALLMDPRPWILLLSLACLRQIIKSVIDITDY